VDQDTEYTEVMRQAVWHILAAADRLESASHFPDIPEEVADNNVEWCRWFRDWADRTFPPVEDWGGSNVIRFPHERVKSA
jgi:hypothetical protein